MEGTVTERREHDSLAPAYTTMYSSINLQKLQCIMNTGKGCALIIHKWAIVSKQYSPFISHP